MCADHEAGSGIPEGFPMTIRTEDCGNCVFCISVCPFEALSQDVATKKVQLDVEKCRLCGICYGACPSNLISVQFYGTVLLSEYVRAAMEKSGLKSIVVACRGNTLPFESIRELVERDKAIYMSIPCLGRITVPFLLDVVEKGIEKVLLIPCQDEFCRFKEGSKVLQSRVQNANLMLEDLGYSSDIIGVFKKHNVPAVDKAKCISCGLCVTICPFGAVSLVKDPSGKRSSWIDPGKCHLCGTCVASCPQEAIAMPSAEDALEGAGGTYGDAAQEGGG
jgi:ferredoxin